MTQIRDDFRSDTVTRPSRGMREAMANAEVGDDVFGDDPTVKRLEATLAERRGNPAAVFMASGTQAILAALLSHCGRGDEYIAGMDAHCYAHEQGGAAWLGSIQPQPIPHEANGTLKLEAIAAAIKPDDPHYARTRLLTLENTLGGRVIPLPYLNEATARAYSTRWWPPIPMSRRSQNPSIRFRCASARDSARRSAQCWWAKPN